MTSQLTIRSETPADEAAIYDITKRAFAPMPYAGGDEQELITTLRDGGALTISLVAELEGVLVGHIAFSPATSDDGAAGWFALGPVSVDPDYQKQGIGGALIKAGFARLNALDAAGCILTGNPTYYQRFGFKPCPDLAPLREPAPFFMAIELGGKRPTARFAFHPLFYNEG
jgi:putative acetyltransferase